MTAQPASASATGDAPRPPAVLAERARKLAADCNITGEVADAVRLVDELIAELDRLAAELDRYQTAAVDPAAELLAPCPPPDAAAGYSDCHPGESWPCRRTLAAWALRGRDADVQVAAAAREWRREMWAMDVDDEPGPPPAAGEDLATAGPPHPTAAARAQAAAERLPTVGRWPG